MIITSDFAVLQLLLLFFVVVAVALVAAVAPALLQ